MLLSSRKSVDLAAPVAGHLNTDMSRRAKAIQSYTATRFNFGLAQSPVADYPGAQKRCGLDILETVRQDGVTESGRAAAGQRVGTTWDGGRR